MSFGNFLITIFIVYTFYGYYNLLFPKNRTELKTKNTKLDELRKIPVKTLEQQKEFVKLKYPESKKWEWINIAYILIKMGCFIVLFAFVRLQFMLYNIQINGLLAITIIIIASIINTLIFKKFNLQKDDITIWFK